MHPVIRGSDVMVLNATFNNISVISVISALLIKEPGKNLNLPQVTDKQVIDKLYYE